MALSPRLKLVAAALLALVVPLMAATQGASTANAARAVLALASVGGLAAWFLRGRSGSSPFKSAPRLQVVQRVGLSQRTGLALVEIDGKPWVVVHGEGYAKLTPTRQPRVPRPALSEATS